MNGLHDAVRRSAFCITLGARSGSRWTMTSGSARSAERSIGRERTSGRSAAPPMLPGRRCLHQRMNSKTDREPERGTSREHAEPYPGEIGIGSGVGLFVDCRLAASRSCLGRSRQQAREMRHSPLAARMAAWSASALKHSAKRRNSCLVAGDGAELASPINRCASARYNSPGERSVCHTSLAVVGRGCIGSLNVRDSMPPLHPGGAPQLIYLKTC